MAPTRRLKSLWRDFGILAAFAALFVGLSFATDVFLTGANLTNVLFQAAPVGIMAVGGTLVFIAGGFDISVGAISAIAGVIAAQLAVQAEVAAPIALIIGALTGLGFGIVNAFLTTVGRINAFIATLATAIIIRGMAIAVSGGGFIISVHDPAYEALGLGKMGGIPNPIWVWVGFSLLTGFLLWKTTIGRHIYAAGGNPEAARQSGVRVNLIRGVAFAISGLSGGIAGVILSSQVSAGQADANLGIEFRAITAIVVGGISIFGGEGAIWRAVLGVLLVQFVGNGFNLINLPQVYQQIALGVILIAAMAVDAWSREREL